eukprot:484618_1
MSDQSSLLESESNTHNEQQDDKMSNSFVERRQFRIDTDYSDVMTNISHYTVTNLARVLVYVVLYVLTATYFIVWIIASNKDVRCVKTKLFGLHYLISYRLIYSMIGTLLHLFIIIICSVFFIKFLIYSNENVLEKMKQNTQKK